MSNHESMARTTAVDKQKKEIENFVRRWIAVRDPFASLSHEGFLLIGAFSAAIAEIIVRKRP